MKVLLIAPPMAVTDRYPKGHPLRVGKQVTEPLGLAYVAAVLERHDIEVRIIDAIVEDLSTAEVITAAKQFNPDIIGMPMWTPTAKVVMDLATEFKNNLPNVYIVVGGIHPTVLPEETLECKAIDFVVRGEGEHAALELVNAIEKKGSLSKIKGLAYREGNKVIINPEREPLKDLDSLPFPARHLLSMPKYKQFLTKNNPAYILFSSRGCPFGCTFCCRDVGGRFYRARKPEKVIEEIKVLINTYGAKEITFSDSLFGAQKEWVFELTELIKKEKLNITWSCNTRANVVSKETLKAMKDAGCWMVYYGIESGDPEILKIINKGETVEEIRQAIKWTNEVGIQSWGSFMFALPGETPESATKTINFAKSLGLDFASFHLTTPFPGTYLFSEASRWGDLEMDYKNYTTLHSIFVPKGYKNKTELDTILKKAFREFYLRPNYFVSRLLKLRSLGDITMNLNGLKAMIKS